MRTCWRDTVVSGIWKSAEASRPMVRARLLDSWVRARDCPSSSMTAVNRIIRSLELQHLDALHAPVTLPGVLVVAQQIDELLARVDSLLGLVHQVEDACEPIVGEDELRIELDGVFVFVDRSI